MGAKVPESFGFYAILTDPLHGYSDTTRILVDLGVPFCQLRMKAQSGPVVAATAQEMRRITEGTNTRLIINDYPEIAKEAGADGVHLGQDDMPYEEARDLLGPEAVIGISTHTPEQTTRACRKHPDYIGIGPVYATPTKNNPDPAVGLNGMRQMLADATVPAVCIGGISVDLLPTVLGAGARNFSMVRPVCQATDPGSVVAEILRRYRRIMASAR